MQFNILQFNTIQNNSIQYNTIQFNTLFHLLIGPRTTQSPKPSIRIEVVVGAVVAIVFALAILALLYIYHTRRTPGYTQEPVKQGKVKFLSSSDLYMHRHSMFYTPCVRLGTTLTEIFLNIYNKSYLIGWMVVYSPITFV